MSLVILVYSASNSSWPVVLLLWRLPQEASLGRTCSTDMSTSQCHCQWTNSKQFLVIMNVRTFHGLSLKVAFLLEPVITRGCNHRDLNNSKSHSVGRPQGRQGRIWRTSVTEKVVLTLSNKCPLVITFFYRIFAWLDDKVSCWSERVTGVSISRSSLPPYSWCPGGSRSSLRRGRGCWVPVSAGVSGETGGGVPRRRCWGRWGVSRWSGSREGTLRWILDTLQEISIHPRTQHLLILTLDVLGDEGLLHLVGLCVVGRGGGRLAGHQDTPLVTTELGSPVLEPNLRRSDCQTVIDRCMEMVEVHLWYRGPMPISLCCNEYIFLS